AGGRCASHLCHRGRQRGGMGTSRRAAAQVRPLRFVLSPAAARPGAQPRAGGGVAGWRFVKKREEARRNAEAKKYVIPPPPEAAIAVAGSEKNFPVRRIWGVGRNYEEHTREMGHDVRDPPFFFAKPADAIVPDGGSVPYPPLTKDMHHEVELVVALKSGGRNIPLDQALDCIYGY